jgi:predicted PurR-regulated permease PerM
MTSTGKRQIQYWALALGVLIFVLTTLLVAPAIVSQAISLFESGPDLFNSLSEWLSKTLPSVFGESTTLSSVMNSAGDVFKERGGEFLSTAFSSAANIIDLAMLFVIVPVVAVYLLLDWHRMSSTIYDLLPRKHEPVIRDLLKKIDKTLAGFIRGTGSVCIILGVYYAISLMLVGLKFGLVVGFAAGLISFIPYLGAILGGLLALGLALFQFWNEWISVAMVVGIFVFGQAVEGNFITPKLVGDSVGLHPVWLIMSLSIFGSLFGFLGLLVAVPLAAIIGVLVRFFIDKYKHSDLYK